MNERTEKTAAGEHDADMAHHSDEHEHGEHRPRGTMLVTALFLIMCIVMFSWAYYILLLRV